MKSLALASLLTFLSVNAVVAKPVEANTMTNTLETQLCIDAVNGASLEQIAERFGVDTFALERQLKCNDQSVGEFVKKHTSNAATAPYVVTQKNINLNVANADGIAKLCAIAATGDMNRLYSASKLNDISVKQFVKQARCNELPVIEFVAEYAGAEVANLLAGKL